MRQSLTTWITLALLVSLTASAQNQQPVNRPGTVVTLPRDLEIQLALSSLPPHLRENATVYVLNPDKGFEVARAGTNGFSALVARTGDDAMRGPWLLTAYPDDILYPISWDQAGAKAQLRVFLDIAEMQAKGTPPLDLKRIIQQRYKTNVYKAPDRAGVSYMLSPILRTYVSPDQNDNVATSSMGTGRTLHIPLSYSTVPMDTSSSLWALWKDRRLLKNTRRCFRSSARSKKCGACQTKRSNESILFRATSLDEAVSVLLKIEEGVMDRVDNSQLLEGSGPFETRYLAFLETVAALRPSLHRYCARMTGSVMDGED